MNISVKKYRVIMIILLSVYWFRLLFLDADVSNFQLAQVQPMDEPYYNELGIKMARFGIGSLINGSQSITSVANAKTFFLPSLLSGLSMKAIGNTFWGLKIPFVCMGFVCLILLAHCTYVITKDRAAVLFASAAFVLDFNVLQLTREAVTVIPCMLAVLILFWMLISERLSSCQKAFLGGTWSVLSFCCVYMGLIFPILIIFLFAAKETLSKKKSGILISYAAGSAVGVLICQIISLTFFQQNIVRTIMDTLAAHGGKINGASKSLGVMVTHAKMYWVSNAFRYNFAFAVFLIMSGIGTLYLFFQKKDEIAFLFLIFILSHWGQTVFLDNMTLSKASITFPIGLMCIVYTAKKVFSEECMERKQKVCICVGTFSVFAGICLKIAGYKLNNVGTSSSDNLILAMTAMLAVFFIVIGLIRPILLKRSISITIIISWIVMAFFSVKYVYVNPTYADKEMLTDIGEMTENGYVINGLGFSLYNDCTCPVSIYDHYQGIGKDYDTVCEKIYEAARNYDDLYWIGYADESKERNPSYINENVLKDTPYEFVPLKTYQREYYASVPGDSDMTLFVKVKKEGL